VAGVILAVVWLGVLLDPRIGPMVRLVLAAFGAVVGLFVGAMGLGLLGFGLCAAGDRFIGWLRQGTRWPEE
jgi:ABC-type microcin C transport system permease subunit YejE